MWFIPSPSDDATPEAQNMLKAQKCFWHKSDLVQQPQGRIKKDILWIPVRVYTFFIIIMKNKQTVIVALSSHSSPLIKLVFPTLHLCGSHWGNWLIKPDLGTSFGYISWYRKTVYAGWSNPVLHHMNHTFPLVPIFTAAAHLDLLKRFTSRWLRKTRNPKCSRLRFSQSLCFLTLSA